MNKHEDAPLFDVRQDQLGKMQDKGFFIRFNNGYEVSVQFGTYNYSDNGKTTAEVAVFDPEGGLVKLGEHDEVRGRVTPERVAELIYEYSLIKKEETV
jgi:hypothetical protein